MGLVGLWLVAGVLVASAVIFGWVTFKTRPMAVGLARRSRPRSHEDVVRQACADLDAEYRELLRQ
jgi:predicted negative regulator of RcsB-dependent stress response